MLKKDVLSILDRKRNGKISSSFKQLSLETGYSKGHLKKLFRQLDNYSIEELSIHKNTGNASHNAACKSEIDYIVKFKELYPVISVAQFKDIYEEDIVLDPQYQEDVKKYNLKLRSYGFYLNLFHKMKWKSPIKHKSKKKDGKERLHLLRKPSERRGHLIQIDGTPFDWFNDGRMYSLHLAVDDATSEVLAGWFTPHECLFGYCKTMYIMLKKYGIPSYVYSDKHSILKGYAGGDTLFSLMMKRIDINQLFANTAEAKGRVERYNGTVQRRIINDIVRFRRKGHKLDDYDDLNIWFNDFYCDYINKKFSFSPYDSNDEFDQIVDENFNYDRVFSVEYERTIKQNSMFSFNSHIYNVIDNVTKKPLYIRKGIKVKVILEILNKNTYVMYHNSKYECNDLGLIAKDRRKNTVDNTKELNELLFDLDNNN